MNTNNEEKLKIAQITPYYYPSIGGVEAVAQYLSEELVKRGHNVDVITTNRDHKERPPLNRPAKEVINGVQVYRYQSIFNLGNMSLYPGLIPRLIKGNYDILHYHNYRHPSCDIAALWGRWKSIPTFLHGHGPFFVQESLPRIKAMLYNIYDKLAVHGTLKRTDIIIALNNFEKEKYLNLGISEKKCVVINNAADDDCFKEIDSSHFIEKYNFQGKRIMLYIGILNGFKRADLLVKALPKIVERVPNAFLVLVGPDGGMLEKVNCIGKELNVQNYYKWIGPLQGKAKHQAYQAAELTMLPSDEEPFGLVILEAMAHSKPVIGSDAIGPKDIIIDGVTGFVIKKRDVEGIADAAIKLLTNKELQENMSKKAKEIAEEKFSVSKIVDRLETLYLNDYEEKCKK